MCSRFAERPRARARDAAGLALLLLALCGLTGACEREVRELRPRPFAAGTIRGEGLGRPAGPGGTTSLRLGAPQPVSALETHYERNAYALAQGKRLYHAFNCSGCHANGGGAIGPPLMDADSLHFADP